MGSGLVVGNGSDGLWTVVVVPSLGDKQQVIRVDPPTGKLAVVATLPAYPPWTSDPAFIQAAWQATTFEGSLFLLDPTTPLPEPDGIEIAGFLYRVAPNCL